MNQAASASGRVQDWSELPGSCKGTLNHKTALANAGYEVMP